MAQIYLKISIMTFRKHLLILVTFSLIALNTFAENEFMKIGKISKEEMNMTVCSIDSNASAVVLGDIGTSYFELTQNDITLINTRHLRIKIFDKESFNKGNISIYLYVGNNGSEEKLLTTKGGVYNTIDGKLVKTKLTNDHIFKENVSKNRKVVKITMPDIKEGSIIDLYYSTSSPFIFNLEPWYFQSDIPTLKSTYEAAIIEWYNYKSWIEGYFDVKKETDSQNKSYSYMTDTRPDPTAQGNGMIKGGRVEFDLLVNSQIYTAENVPAFKNEPYTINPRDYFSSVHFELLSTHFPRGGYKSYTKTWREINRLLNENEDFGVTLNYSGHLKEIAEQIKQKTDDPEQQAKLAYNHINKNIAWDGRHRIYVDRSIRNAYNTKTGNSADINLNLVALCKLLDLDAYPVIISTRGHGKLRPGLISLAQFNHVITVVKFNDKQLLMDATDENCPYNILPPKCLNDKGRLVNEGEGEWVELYTTKKRNEFYMATLSFNENMELNGDLSFRASNYAALNFRDKYKSEESEKDFLIELEKQLNGIRFDEFNIENIDSLDKAIVVKSKISTSEGINIVNDMVFFNPKIIKNMHENIFKLEERVYPVDFNYPFKEQYTFTIQLPEGYIVDEIPEPLVVTLPENGGKYVYMVKVVGSSLQFNCQFAINQTIFSSVDYPDLRKFYELIVAKEAEQIVLKKNN